MQRYKVLILSWNFQREGCWCVIPRTSSRDGWILIQKYGVSEGISISMGSTLKNFDTVRKAKTHVQNLLKPVGARADFREVTMPYVGGKVNHKPQDIDTLYKLLTNGD